MLEWHSKGSECGQRAGFNRDFNTESSFTRYSLSISSLSFKRPLKCSWGRDQDGGPPAMLFITVFFSLTSLVIRSVLITVHDDRTRTHTHKSTCAHYSNAHHRLIRGSEDNCVYQPSTHFTHVNQLISRIGRKLITLLVITRPIFCYETCSKRGSPASG